MNLEDLRPIEGCEGYYVDKNGNIVSIKIRNLKGSLTQDGYRQYHISNKGEDKYIIGHVAVARAFLENPNNYPIVNHKDGNKQNNSMDNLEWCNYSYNSYHSCHVLGNKPPITCEKPVICIDTLNNNKTFYFRSMSECGRFFNVDYGSIYNKIIGKSKNPTMRNTKLKGLFFKFADSVESETTIENTSNNDGSK